ncbi:hypothetical protein ACFOZ0_22730 [Streptomyces yaanensis]|uniref:Secreted protein n=1 Tax=Streptomyces yaanensis TaxID=1142239 RepID=A0ABV7SGF5_9ACTN|nr:hypothetical protein [Streptomyces sp. CGMCC 4.7035]WNC01039.1 hypothetical protein Q2K21_24945 [Streptomyces sp. CGMCC 4.7035]
MSARTHTRTHPATTGGLDIRLPWWALALPTLAFVILLALILNPADASAGGDPALSHLVEHVQQAVTHHAS